MDKLQYERKYYERGLRCVAGVDEAGRGPLAGPLVCCAVIMPTGDEDIIEGVDDSKKLTLKKRERLAELIKAKAIAYNVVEISPQEVDEVNIYQAVRKCMTLAAEGLKVKPDAVLVDGPNLHLDIEAEYVVKGDMKSYTIGCASIIAKTYRDALMVKYAEEYPEYGFEKNKGYGSAAHIRAVKEKGPCKLHRRTFIKNFWVESAKEKPQNT